MYIDTHAHFDITMEQTSYTEEDLINGMKEQSIVKAVQVATEFSNFQWSYDFSLKYSHIYCALGIHPSSDFQKDDFDKLHKMVSEIFASENGEKLIGIGEIGLDYHWMTYTKEEQQEYFLKQINIAKEFNLPVIIHSRDAFEDTYKVLKDAAVEKGILHCFGYGKKEAEAFLDLGMDISFAGNVTFKKAVDLQEAARYVPLDRLLLETDCPYLAPVPKRGKKNRPEFVVHSYDFISELKGIKLEELKESLYNNFQRIFF